LSAAIPVLKLMNPDLKCYGYLHAGSWGDGDIFNGVPGKNFLERAMFDIFDRIFVATNYHKKKIGKYFGKEFDNIQVVGFPFYKEDVYRYAKPLPYREKNDIIICGRAEQSNLESIEKLQKCFPEENIFLLEVNDRKTYYDYLNNAKIVISMKIEETFGITPLETYVLGGIPLCPNDFSYPEVIREKQLLYNDENDLINKLSSLISLDENPFQISIEKYAYTIPLCMDFINQE
ncbi:MAG: glycosyltransferase, partial [Candidatus Heimdallarchaeaceae archaeon]